MNFIRVSKNVGSSDHKNDPILNKFHTYQIIFNGLEYLIGVDNKTSSFFRTDNYFFIGESFSPELSKQLDLEKLIKANPEKNTHISKDYFSAILMDMKQKQVFLFSSQGHQRAVYYAMEAENFYCASQLHLLKNLGCSFETNNEVLGELFNFHTLAAPRTLIKGIRRMNPTEQLKFNLFDNKSRQCWQIDFQPIISNEKDINEIGGMTERIISSEISNMIAKDPSTSILLNGDLGSSLLAAIVNEQNKNITTFSTSFDFPFKDEQAPPFAARVANHLKVQHQVCTCTDLEYLCNMVDAIAYTGETLHSPQTVLLWNLFRQCSMHGRSTLICGWGANSLFGNDLHYKLNKYSGIVNLLRKENIQAVVRGFG
ncbi:MAG: asparagine synthase-related protein, partial [bacterium]